MGSYCLHVTYSCNWTCDYCITDTHNKDNPSLDYLFNQIETIPDGARVSLSGGEPGLLPDGKLIQIIEKLKSKGCEIGINSNGVIFKKPHIIDMIDYILYHCSEYLDINDVIIRDFKEKTTYMLVVSNDTYHLLDDFVQKHNDIKFKIYPAYGYLDVDKSIKIYRKYKDYLDEGNRMALIHFKSQVNKLTML